MNNFQLEDIVEVLDHESCFFGKRGVVIMLDCGDRTSFSDRGVTVAFVEYFKLKDDSWVNTIGVPATDLHFLRKVERPE